MVLKWMTIVIGALTVVGKGSGLIFPGLAQKMIAAMMARKLLLLVLMLLVTILGAFFIGLSHEALREKTCETWQAVVMLIVGVYIAGAGLLFLAVPKLYILLLVMARGWSPRTIRLFSLLAIVFGVALLLVGLKMPG